MKLNPAEFADFLEERAAAGDGYIMCAVGQDPKKLSEWYFSGQYSGEQLEQARRWKEIAERVWDCQGMADGYTTEKLGFNTNVRARNNFAEWCGVRGEGDIPPERRVRGAAVFHRGSYVDHVGFLVRPVRNGYPEGDWYVVEARGVAYGVVTTKLSQRSWNCWGWMTKYFDYPEVEEELNEYGWRNLRYGMSGSDVSALQLDLIALNYSCGKWGADGEFGRSTQSALMAFQHDNGLEADGIAGPRTFDKLNELLPENGEMVERDDPYVYLCISAGSTWNVRTKPNASAPVLGYVKRGQLFAPSNEKADGWVGIIFNGEEAWVSAKAVGK
ncbi:MAG: peptidoglycan-binding protein [Clostridia bacterium]|nr:peptidoglycan-binding protein [Clostridia bacterium]